MLTSEKCKISADEEFLTNHLRNVPLLNLLVMFVIFPTPLRKYFKRNYFGSTLSYYSLCTEDLSKIIQVFFFCIMSVEKISWAFEGPMRWVNRSFNPAQRGKKEEVSSPVIPLYAILNNILYVVLGKSKISSVPLQAHIRFKRQISLFFFFF